MKKAFIVLLIIGAIIYLQSKRSAQFDKETAAEDKSTPLEAPATPKAAPPSPPKPQAPLANLRLPSPATPAQMQAVIPDFAALESQLRAAATGAGIKFTDDQFFEAMGHGWNALAGRGGTPQDRYKYDMGMFDISGARREYDGKITEERTNTFQFLQNGQKVYTTKCPASGDGITECWEKVEKERGTEYHPGYVTIGGTKFFWVKLTWD